MKAILLSLLVISSSLLCAAPKVVSFDKIQYRIKDGSKLAYIPNQETPFTGKAVDFYKNGQKEKEGNYTDGKLEGLRTLWYENEQKQEDWNFKDGKLISAEVWKPNGEKCPVTNVKDGNGVIVWYNMDGTERFRYTYKNGELGWD